MWMEKQEAVRLLKKSLLVLTVTVGMLSALQPDHAKAAQQVTVTIPKYKVEINGVTVDNANNKYPLLSYNDITYVPMTWDYCRTLGLAVNWNEQTGLSINQDSMMPQKLTQDVSARNDLSKSYSARVADFPITVNGKAIDQNNEKYPLLLFRDITYFPMTWRFAHDEFKWETSWDHTEGFRIVSPQRKYLSEVVDDDAGFLYVRSNFDKYYKISKSLNGDITVLTDDESNVLLKRLSDKSRNHSAYHLAEKEEKPERIGDSIVYKNIELMSLTPLINMNNAFYEKETQYENKGVSFYGTAIPLNDSKSIVSLTIFTLQHIPAPYTPHTNHLFIVDHSAGIAQEMSGYNQSIRYVYNNADGTFWIASGNAPQSITARNADLRAQLLLISQDGTPRLINDLLHAADVDVLNVTPEGKLLVHAYNDRMYPFERSEGDGFYTIDTDGHAEKRYDPVSGEAYADDGGNIYVIDKSKNQITNLATGVSKLWWDYEFEP
jgi:hypothetical protein